MICIYYVGSMLPFVMLLLLLALLFFEAFHAESIVVFNFILGQTSLARFALFFSKYQVHDYISSQ